MWGGLGKGGWIALEQGASARSLHSCVSASHAPAVQPARTGAIRGSISRNAGRPAVSDPGHLAAVSPQSVAGLKLGSAQALAQGHVMMPSRPGAGLVGQPQSLFSVSKAGMFLAAGRCCFGIGHRNLTPGLFPAHRLGLAGTPGSRLAVQRWERPARSASP